MNTTAGNRQKRKGKGRRAGVIHLVTRKLKFSVTSFTVEKKRPLDKRSV